MQPVHVTFTDFLQRRRLQTLQSVDAALEKLTHELRTLNMLSHSYLLYTSDHGYHLGQFGLIKGKNMPYEFDLKVPMCVAVHPSHIRSGSISILGLCGDL